MTRVLLPGPVHRGVPRQRTPTMTGARPVDEKLLEFALLTRPMGVAVPFEGYERHPSRDRNACFCGALAVDQAALAIGVGPATGMRRDFRPFRANSPSTRQFQKRRIR